MSLKKIKLSPNQRRYLGEYAAHQQVSEALQKKVLSDKVSLVESNEILKTIIVHKCDQLIALLNILDEISEWTE